MDSNLTNNFFELCLGNQDPSVKLLETGTMDSEWIEKFTESFTKVYNYWINKEMLPKKIVAALLHVNRFGAVQYTLWSERTGESNNETAKILNMLNDRTLSLLMSGRVV